MAWPLTNSDVRRALGFDASQGDSEELTRYATGAMERVEEMVGRCRGQATTSTHSGPRHTITLNEVPAAVVVTIDGAPFADFAADLEAGILYGPFRGRRIQVTCVAPAEPPMIVQISCEELAAIWYRQANTGAIGRGRGSNTTWSPLGFAIPREIDEKLAPYAAKKLPGIG